MRYFISSVAAISILLTWNAWTQEAAFDFVKDMSYSATVPVNVGPVPEDARYVRFTMQVPEGTELKQLWAVEGLGDGEVWTLECARVILTGESREYFFPLAEEIGRPPWVVDLQGTDIAVLPTRELFLGLTKAPPQGDGKLDPAAVDQLIFLFGAVEGVDPLGLGSYRVAGLQFTSESPVERALAELESVSVEVDARAVLGDVNPIWRDLFMANDVTVSLPERTIRLPDSLPGTRGAFPQDGLDGQFNWGPTEWPLELARRAERIIQCVGRDTPAFLWNPDKPESSEPAQWTAHPGTWREGNLLPPHDMKAYEELHFQTAVHYNVEKRYGIEYFEFWTEPEVLAWYRGSVSDYARMYAAFARGIKRGDPRAKVGCPGLASYNVHWLRAILKHCTANDVPLDFVSFHHYGPHARAFEDHIAHFRRVLLDSEFPRYKDVEIVWSEWNNLIIPSQEAIAFKTSAAHAAFAADSIKHMSDQRVDIATFAFVPGDEKLWKGAGLFLGDQKTPKPVYNTLRLFTAMEGTRATRVKADVSSDEGLGLCAFATKAEEHVAVAIWWNLEIPDPPGLSRTGTLRVTRVPFSGAAILERYLIDENHSNYHAGPEHQDLEKVEERSVRIRDGTLEIPIEVAVSSVQLFKIIPASVSE